MKVHELRADDTDKRIGESCEPSLSQLIARVIKQLRVASDYGRKRLPNTFGVSRAAYYKAEFGRNTSLSSIARILAMYNLCAEEFISILVGDVVVPEVISLDLVHNCTKVHADTIASNLHNYIGSVLKEIRKIKGFSSQGDLAAKVNCGRNTIMFLESGRGNPCVSTIDNILNSVQVSTETFVSLLKAEVSRRAVPYNAVLDSLRMKKTAARKPVDIVDSQFSDAIDGRFKILSVEISNALRQLRRAAGFVTPTEFSKEYNLIPRKYNNVECCKGRVSTKSIIQITCIHNLGSDVLIKVLANRVDTESIFHDNAWQAKTANVKTEVDKFNKRIGAVFRRVRIGRSFSQLKLADQFNLTIDYIGRVERGQIDLSLRSIAKALVVYDLAVEEFFDLLADSTYANEESTIISPSSLRHKHIDY